MVSKAAYLISLIAMLFFLAPPADAEREWISDCQLPSEVDSDPPPDIYFSSDDSRFSDVNDATGVCECPAESCPGAEPPARHCYADVEIMFLRAHFSEEVLGKLAEQYQFSPRFVFGVEKAAGHGLRTRFWSYDQVTPNLQGGDSLDLDFEIFDLEGTHRIGNERTQLLLSGGFRWADIHIDVDDAISRNDMPGATFAADLRSYLCSKHRLEWSCVGGIRWSVLGGDWEGSQNGIISPTRDDNLTVTEIYGGFECRYERQGADFYSRIVFETQNWTSDALGNATGVDSIGFIGPGFYFGLMR